MEVEGAQVVRLLNGRGKGQIRIQGCTHRRCAIAVGLSGFRKAPPRSAFLLPAVFVMDRDWEAVYRPDRPFPGRAGLRLGTEGTGGIAGGATAVHSSGDWLYVAGPGAIAALNRQGFQTFTTTNGWCAEDVTQILDDGRGNLFLGDPPGIYRFSVAELRSDAHAISCRKYGRGDGLLVPRGATRQLTLYRP